MKSLSLFAVVALSFAAISNAAEASGQPVIVATPTTAETAMAKHGQDARCLLQASALIRLHTGPVHEMAMRMAAFYMGRLDGRISDAHLEHVLESHSFLVSPEAIAVALKDPAVFLDPACGKTMEQRGAIIRDLGERLQKKGRKAEAPPKHPAGFVI